MTLVKVLTKKVWVSAPSHGGTGWGTVFLRSKMVEAATSEWI